MTRFDDVKRPRRKRAGAFHHGDLAAQLVVAAEALIESEGHHGLTLKRLAQQLGVTDAAIYRHFRNRDALLAEVAVRGHLRFFEAMLAAQAGVSDPFESVARFGKAYLRYAYAHPGLFRLQFSRTTTEGLHHLPGVAERLAPAEAARQQLLLRWRGALPPGDDRAADLYRLVWGTAHGLANFVVERVFQLVQTDAERLAAADVALEMLVASLRVRAGERCATGG